MSASPHIIRVPDQCQRHKYKKQSKERKQAGKKKNYGLEKEK